MSSRDIRIKTLELYDRLPQNLEDRIGRVDIRDEIINLNYPFFYYIALHTYIKNSCVDHDDKLQSVLLNFCKTWWRYKWDGTGGNSSLRPLRQDLSFTTFFKPRLSAAIRNDLSDVSYTTRRTTLRKVGEMLNKHWTKVTLEDLDKVVLDPIDMNIARQVLDPNCRISFEFESIVHPSTSHESNFIETSNSDDYNSIEEMLIHETIEKEDKLNNSELKYLAEILGLNYSELLEIYPKALDILAERLRESINEHNLES